jgi:predicted phosphodiesterase
MKARITSLAGVALLTFGCMRPAEERARQDERVGKAEGAGLVVDVAEGLAVVRKLDADRLVLWGSAPAFDVELTVSGGPRSLTLEIWNALPDVQVEPSRGAATALPLGPVPTRPAFRLDLPDGVARLRVAPPGAETPGALRFAVMSDVQEAIDDVGDIYARVNTEPGVRFLLGAGDLTRRGSDDELARFEAELRALAIPYFTTLGNHELGESPTRYQDWFGRGSFQFAFRGVTFTLLDSASATLDPIVYDWLEGWLARGRRSVHVVAMHIPPLDPIGVRGGAFASRAEAAKLLGLLARGSVDLTLYGHIHSFYAFDNAAIPAYISGGGGAIPERFDDVGRHFLVVDVDGTGGVRDTRVVRVD